MKQDWTFHFVSNFLTGLAEEVLSFWEQLNLPLLMMLLEHLSAFFNFIQLFRESMHSYILEYESYPMAWGENYWYSKCNYSTIFNKNVIFVKKVLNEHFLCRFLFEFRTHKLPKLVLTDFLRHSSEINFSLFKVFSQNLKIFKDMKFRSINGWLTLTHSMTSSFSDRCTLRVG